MQEVQKKSLFELMCKRQYRNNRLSEFIPQLQVTCRLWIHSLWIHHQLEVSSLSFLHNLYMLFSTVFFSNMPP